MYYIIYTIYYSRCCSYHVQHILWCIVHAICMQQPAAPGLHGGLQGSDVLSDGDAVVLQVLI